MLNHLREMAIHEILRIYMPMLIREYIKYNKGEGRKVPASDFTEEIKLETAKAKDIVKDTLWVIN